MNYNMMSVHELLLEAAEDGMQGFLHKAYPELCELPEIESAIRKAVIREASAGTCHIGIGYNLTLDKPSTPDGDYYLVPQERKP